jgi:hypothetical protein
MQMTGSAITGLLAIISTTGTRAITAIMEIIMGGAAAIMAIMGIIMAGAAAMDTISIISNTTITIIFMAIARTRTTMGLPIAPGITMA